MSVKVNSGKGIILSNDCFTLEVVIYENGLVRLVFNGALFAKKMFSCKTISDTEKSIVSFGLANLSALFDISDPEYRKGCNQLLESLLAQLKSD